MRSIIRLILFFTIGLFSLGVSLSSANEGPKEKATLVSTPQELADALTKKEKEIEITTSMTLDALTLSYPVEIEGQKGVVLTLTGGKTDVGKVGVIIDHKNVEFEELAVTFKNVDYGIWVKKGENTKLEKLCLDGIVVKSYIYLDQTENTQMEDLIIDGGTSRSNILLENSSATLKDSTFKNGKYVDIRLESKKDCKTPSILTLKGKQKYSTNIAILSLDTQNVTHQVIGFNGRVVAIGPRTNAYFIK